MLKSAVLGLAIHMAALHPMGAEYTPPPPRVSVLPIWAQADTPLAGSTDLCELNPTDTVEALFAKAMGCPAFGDLLLPLFLRP